MIHIKKYVQFILEHNENSIIVKYPKYRVIWHTDYDSNIVYTGYDYDDALYEFNNLTQYDIGGSMGVSATVLLEQFEYEYQFIHNLESDTETVEDDYPIRDFYTNENYYKLINPDIESTELMHRNIEPVNKGSDELLHQVENYYKKKYGNYKYNKIYVYAEDDLDEDAELGSIQLRIADHTENISNVDRFGRPDYHISVVIADHDVTRKRFGQKNAFERRGSREVELTYTSDDEFDGVIEEIDNQIEEGIEYIRKHQ